MVDEASMIDLTMMSRPDRCATTPCARGFPGDRDQLASVEAGAVLGDNLYLRQLRLYRRAGAGARPSDRLLA